MGILEERKLEAQALANYEYEEYLKTERVNRYKKQSLIGRNYENANIDTLQATKTIGFETAVKRLKKYVENFEIIKNLKDAKNSIYIYGKQNGSGKTHLAHCVRNGLKDYAVLFTNMESLVDKIKESYDNGMSENETDIINNLLEVDLLILDDFGFEKKTEFMIKTMFKILDKLMINKVPIIFTSNLSIEDFVNENTSDYNRLRIGDRLKGYCVELELKLEKQSDSFRRKQKEVF